MQSKINSQPDACDIMCQKFFLNFLNFSSFYYSYSFSIQNIINIILFNKYYNNIFNIFIMNI